MYVGANARGNDLRRQEAVEEVRQQLHANLAHACEVIRHGAVPRNVDKQQHPAENVTAELRSRLVLATRRFVGKEAAQVIPALAHRPSGITLVGRHVSDGVAESTQPTSVTFLFFSARRPSISSAWN